MLIRPLRKIQIRKVRVPRGDGGRMNHYANETNEAFAMTYRIRENTRARS